MVHFIFIPLILIGLYVALAFCAAREPFKLDKTIHKWVGSLPLSTDCFTKRLHLDWLKKRKPIHETDPWRLYSHLAKQQR
jgi:hypothetical protein